ncbi:hypothetical protein KKE06_00995 [Candidatus Micrarchaeota archaeon]|nr:hypothetical protein [Candidatus Micrarchaeota archaeon]MBU1929881.1 hypothetical protein [Candidatus Micrarchaeota archaeon]
MSAQEHLEQITENPKRVVAACLKSTKFLEACKTRKVDPQKTALKMINAMSSNSSKPWVAARIAFVNSMQRVLEKETDPVQIVLRRRKVLFAIFSQLLIPRKRR